uniref:Uncharacterized protein n=1 Tax=Panagrolaimus sp. PS1159 TaxID=55785 RepID=A0AC35GQM9_9BILA
MSSTGDFLAAMAAGISAQHSFSNQSKNLNETDKYTYSVNPPPSSVAPTNNFSLKMLLYMRAQRTRELAKINKMKFAGA